MFATSSAENEFPPLPVLDEKGVVWISAWPDRAALLENREPLGSAVREATGLVPMAEFALTLGFRSRLRGSHTP